MTIHKAKGTLEESKQRLIEIINKPMHRQEIIKLVMGLLDKNAALREALESAYVAIEDAICCDDGLDGYEGQGVLKMIAEVHPGAKELADKERTDALEGK
ncbi:hypothetical protein LCGC14_0812210 [marine sediment metagenome]|uniref:Uncharacterized protein n=1 Tax=marine sediment metagenome TaxID=412755 RepID=A0A0F9STN6_9ZZZZ